jgi:Ca2+-binding RTX toxin-like protein
MPRLLASTAVALLACAIASASASGEPGQVSAHGPGSHAEPGGVGILGSSDDDQIEVRSPAADTIVVFDLVGLTAVQDCQLQFEFSSWGPDVCGCDPVDTMNVTCDTPYGMDVSAGLGGGDDALSVIDPMTLRASGGGGADRLTGSSLADYLRGGQGPDRVSGGQGDDQLFPFRGRDAVYGGPGNDFLWLHNGDRDRVIDCGPGNDRAYVDRANDPDPLGCEHVRFAPRGT